jgi:hypothetical protein
MKRDITKEPTLIRQLPSDKSRHTMFLYECQYCHNIFKARFSEVLAHKVISCGCQRRCRREEHTQRQLATWGASKTKWVGLRFLEHSRLQSAARLAADKKLMRSLGIKDKDILFKSAQVALQQGPARKEQVLPTGQLLTSSPLEPSMPVPLSPPEVAYAPLISGDGNTPRSTVTPVHSALMSGNEHFREASRTTTNNYYGGVVNNYNSRESLSVDKPFEQTEAGFEAECRYWQEFQKGPPIDFDLQRWAQQKRVN